MPARSERSIIAATERDQVERKPEEVEQQQREPEVGNGGENRREGGQDDVEDRATPPGNEDAEEGPDYEANHDRNADDAYR